MTLTRGEARGRLAQVPRRREALLFLAKLGGATRASAMRAVVDGLVVTLTLKRRGVRPLLRTANTARARHDPQRSLEVSKAVDAGFSLIPVAPTCLRRSLTLARELDRLGLARTVHVGVRNVDGHVEAHAWVQAGDVVVNDDPEVTETYVELARGELETVLPLLR